MMSYLMVWITRGLNPVGALEMTVCVLYRGTSVVLHVLQDSFNSINNGLNDRIYHTEEIYGISTTIYNILST